MTELDVIRYIDLHLSVLRFIILLGVLKLSADLKRLCGKWEAGG